MKKVFSAAVAAVMALTLFTACGGSGGEFDPASDITVVSREDGSGTRGAFTELFGIIEKDSSGGSKDLTTQGAVIANQTGVMMSNITNDPYAIGYISLGSLDSSVKALSVDGIEASTENVKNGSYTIARPFIIATKKEGASELAQDFIDYIFSAEGQEVVAQSYIAIIDDAPAYAGKKPSGKLTIAGSSSVTPVMEKLAEAYEKVNTNASIEIQMSDSSAGMTAAMDGTCDIGMASRDLKDSESAKLTPLEIAIDGIAVIVNTSNPAEGASTEQIKNIFTGKTTVWSDIEG